MLRAFQDDAVFTPVWGDESIFPLLNVLGDDIGVVLGTQERIFKV